MTLPRRLRAPPEHGAVLAEPPLAEAETWIAANRRQFTTLAFPLLGRSWADLRRQGRQAAIAAAKEYVQQAGEPSPDYGDASLIMAGHQPEIFHPGVWVKNFALNALARSAAATPVNLIVDQDTAKTTSLRLPALAGPQVVSLPFDDWKGEVPHEERTVNDETLFASLPERAAPILNDWPFVPLLAAFWAEARRQAERTPLLGERLVAARRAFERRWGCHNLELPVSRLCRTEPFAWFACHLLADLPRFHAIYNRCVHAYRQRYGIRSRNHPVPDLLQEGNWLEAPFWAWRAGSKQRGRLLVQPSERTLALRVGAETWPELPAPADQNPTALVHAWQALEARGFKVRSRALTNTLFARLFLADLFVHGIGGGKYDELTDEIARCFYGFEPPRYLVLSATLLLPLRTFPVDLAGRQRLAREVRDLYYNPQRYVDNGLRVPPPAHDLAAAKQEWIARSPTNSQERRERFEALRALTEELRIHVADRLSARERQILLYDRELQGNAVLERRDYGFCLYPETMLRSFCTQFLRQTN